MTLTFYHLQGYESRVELLQAMEEDDFVREHIAPKKGIKKSAFYEATSERGLLQLQEVFQTLYAQAKNIEKLIKGTQWLLTTQKGIQEEDRKIDRDVAKGL